MNTDVSALYIHIPYCISKCQYCDFFSVTHLEKKQIPESYISALCKEIDFRLKKYKVSQLKSIYIGGGTPSLLTSSQLQQIISIIKNNVFLSTGYEFSMELNPDDITAEYLDFLSSTPINRLSVGLQSLNQKCLSFAKRRATAEQNLKALELLQKHFPKFSIDFICGLPEESEESFLQGLSTAISFNPKHISMYSLTIEEETPFGKLLDSGKLNYDFDKADSLWLKARDLLCQNGYSQYEVSNFASKENQCVHNLAYWNHQSYLGCGSGGTGTVYNKDGTGFRWTNSTNIQDYISFWTNNSPASALEPSITEEIDLPTSQFEFFMMGLRKLSGITNIEFTKIFNQPLPANFVSLAEKWKEDNLMEISVFNNSIRYNLNSQGILFLNQFLEELM